MRKPYNKTMNKKYFRYQYENSEDGIVQSGCVWNNTKEKRTNYLYLAGEYTKSPKFKNQGEEGLKTLSPDSVLDIFVLGAYTVSYLRKLMEILDERTVKTVIMPYVLPKDRLYMMEYMEKRGGFPERLREFVGAPYTYLKKKQVENVYLIYDNGQVLTKDTEELEEGHHFNLMDKAELDKIEKIEGVRIPVYQAGYIVDNQWLYYFGFYGADYDIKAERTVWSSITMFTGPIGARNKNTDCMFATKVFTREQQCSAEISKNNETCDLTCIHRNDYDTIKKHLDNEHEELRIGLLNLGNVNLKDDLYGVIHRYGAFLNQIRAISVPNCGNIHWWNKKVISFFTGTEYIYYGCRSGVNTAPEVIGDIVEASSFNRIANVNEEFAYCFSGYLIPKEEN